MRVYGRTADVVELMNGWMDGNQEKMEGELHGRYTNARKEGRAGERSEIRDNETELHSHTHTYAHYLTTRAFTHTRTPPCTQGVDTHPLLSDDPRNWNWNTGNWNGDLARVGRRIRLDRFGLGRG
ncbi:hypothetical protein BDP67DRAFT_532257 [Colletotrichum lupini]|nr:hypothetical protein BDP67DRAFT_532257 [Colletotrichum lupini]